MIYIKKYNTIDIEIMGDIMRIGIFVDAYEPHISGVTTSVKVLKETLEKMGHQVLLVTANLENMKFIYDEKKKIIYIPGIKTGIYSTRLTPIYSKKAMKIIKSWNLDVIHSQTEFGVGTFSRIVAKKLKIPVVHTYHTFYEDYVHYITHGHFDSFAKKIAIKITKYFCDKKCDELIVPTDKIKDLFINKYNITHPINVLPTGIDISFFKKNKKMIPEIEKIKKKYNIKKTDFIVGSVGRIAKEKNLDELIQTFKKLANFNPNIKLMLVGGGPYLEDVKRLIKQFEIEDNVILTDSVVYEKIPVFYNVFDTVVSFSTSETQGLTIIEGLSAGKPTLCINDICFRQVIENGYNGYLFNKGDEFIDLILKLVRDKKKYEEMSLNAENSTYRYSREVFGAEVLKIYNRAIEDKKNEND